MPNCVTSKNLEHFFEVIIILILQHMKYLIFAALTVMASSLKLEEQHETIF